MSRYYALAVTTKYWTPKTDYVREIIHALSGKIAEADFVVVSEKALSTARNNIVDENKFCPSANAKIIATIWMPVGWGYFIGVVCHFGQRLLSRIRNYPAETGSRHKQVALQYAGLGQALMFGSEGGIDGSNLPYSLVSLPLRDASEVAEEIRLQILHVLGKKVTVIIVDTDKTYSFRNFHFTPRPKPLKGIYSRGGIIAYVIGRAFKLRKRPTPLALAGNSVNTEEALTIANVADRARGPGSGATVWDMAARFRVAATGVTWDMLSNVRHKPLVIVRRATHTKSSAGAEHRQN
jgi:F420-0:gamma-glutamyl ligase-like protein